MRLDRFRRGLPFFFGVSVLWGLILSPAGCDRGHDQAQKETNHVGQTTHDHDGHDHGHDNHDGRDEDLHGHDDHDDGDAHNDAQDDHDHGEECTHSHEADKTWEQTIQPAAGATTRVVEIPPAVRQNLGITFVRVERRPVRSTVRLPGQFELRPEARREYHVMLSGRVDLAVQQFQSVAPGDLLFRLDSPEWRRVQSKLAEAFKACYCCLPELDAARAAQRENQAQIEFLERRIANLAGAEARDVSLEAELAKLRMRTERLDAEVRAKDSDRVSSELAYSVLLNEAQSLAGVSREILEEELPKAEEDSLAIPRWTTISEIVVRAEAAGVVNRIGVTDQGWAETGDLVVETIDPGVIRFHADALQTDIGRFSEGMSALVVPPPGGSIDLQDTIEGTIAVGFQAHPEERTVPIYLVPARLPRWAKAGVTAYLEVLTDGHNDTVLAIPEAAVVRDGLDMVFFRRDPHDPDRVVRVVARLGTSDGRWIEVQQGANEGDEIVLGGVYPLMLASSSGGEFQPGGHFHGDGTFHEGEDH